MESARLARRHDLHPIAGLWNAAKAELEGLRGGAIALASLPVGPPLALLAAAIERPDDILVAGLIDEVVVGFGYGRLHQGARDRIGVVEMLYVEPEARAVGVGEAIADVLIGQFQVMGCSGVDALALPGSRSAKAFFETNGFVTRLLVMHRPLGQDARRADHRGRTDRSQDSTGLAPGHDSAESQGY